MYGSPDTQNSQCKNLCVSGVLKAIPRFGGISQRPAQLSILSYSRLRFITVKAKSAKGKGIWIKVLSKLSTHFHEPSPMESLSALNACSNTLEMLSSRKAHQRPSARDLVTQVPSAQHVPTKFTVKKKECVQYKAHCLHKQFRHSEPVLTGNSGNPPFTNPNFQTPAKGNLERRPFHRWRCQDCSVKSFLYTL